MLSGAGCLLSFPRSAWGVSRRRHRLSLKRCRSARSRPVEPILPGRVRACPERVARTLAREVRSQRRSVTGGGEGARQRESGRSHVSASMGSHAPPRAEALANRSVRPAAVPRCGPCAGSGRQAQAADHRGVWCGRLDTMADDADRRESYVVSAQVSCVGVRLAYKSLTKGPDDATVRGRHPCRPRLKDDSSSRVAAAGRSGDGQRKNRVPGGRSA